MTMTATITGRDAAIEKAVADARRWSRYVDTLLDAFRSNGEAPAALGARLEALRNKRDSVVTKVEALKRHRTRDWARARRELDAARGELRECWRSVIGTLDREDLFA